MFWGELKEPISGILDVFAELCLIVFVNITLFFKRFNGSIKVVMYFCLELQWMTKKVWYVGGTDKRANSAAWSEDEIFWVSLIGREVDGCNGVIWREFSSSLGASFGDRVSYILNMILIFGMIKSCFFFELYFLNWLLLFGG